MKIRNAFTMLEMVFVIVVIGILSAIAIPKFAATRDDALISRARSSVAAMRSAVITERQKRILKGVFTDIANTDVTGLLDHPLGSDWSGLTFTAPDGTSCTFSVEEAGKKNKLVKKTCSVAGMSDL